MSNCGRAAREHFMKRATTVYFSNRNSTFGSHIPWPHREKRQHIPEPNKRTKNKTEKEKCLRIFLTFVGSLNYPLNETIKMLSIRPNSVISVFRLFFLLPHFWFRNCNHIIFFFFQKKIVRFEIKANKTINAAFSRLNMWRWCSSIAICLCSSGNGFSLFFFSYDSFKQINKWFLFNSLACRCMHRLAQFERK